MSSQRAVNRQKYNATKPLKKPSLSLSSNSEMSEPTANKSGLSLPDFMSGWETLTSQQLLSLTESQLTQLESQLSPSQKQLLSQKLLLALNSQSQPQRPLTYQPLASFPPDQPISPIDNSGAAPRMNSPEASTGYTAPSAVPDQQPEGIAELLAPLTGKDLRRQRDIEGLLGMVAGVLLTVNKVTKNIIWYKDAEAIGKYGEEVAESWARLGRKYAWLARGIDIVVAGGQVGLLAASTGNMLSEIAGNHGVSIPSFRLGSMESSATPGTLAA